MPHVMHATLCHQMALMATSCHNLMHATFYQLPPNGPDSLPHLEKFLLPLCLFNYLEKNL